MKPNSLSRSFFSSLAAAVCLGLLFGCNAKNPTPPQSTAPAAKKKAVQEPENNADRVKSLDKLKTISLAILNYCGSRRGFPPAYAAGKNGKPLLSWRVLILPYVDQFNLFRQFHLDEPWDSQHNKALLANMPNIYKTPGSKVAGEYRTNYLAVRGKDTIFSGKTSCHPGAVRDGMTNTVMIVEASDAKAVEWTRPDDFEFDPQNPSDGLVGLRDNAFLIGVADGSVRSIAVPKSPEILNAWFNKNDRKPVQIDE
jgi:hypothetical protein